MPYRRTGVMQIRKKFNKAKKKATTLYAAHSHQSEQSGAAGESRPIYTPLFFEYFDFCETHETPFNVARLARERHTRVNRSIVGQHPALSSANAPVLLSTVAPSGCVRGSGDVGGEVVVLEMSTTSSARLASEREKVTRPHHPQEVSLPMTGGHGVRGE